MSGSHQHLTEAELKEWGIIQLSELAWARELLHDHNLLRERTQIVECLKRFDGKNIPVVARVTGLAKPFTLEGFNSSHFKYYLTDRVYVLIEKEVDVDEEYSTVKGFNRVEIKVEISRYEGLKNWKAKATKDNFCRGTFNDLHEEVHLNVYEVTFVQPNPNLIPNGVPYSAPERGGPLVFAMYVGKPFKASKFAYAWYRGGDYEVWYTGRAIYRKMVGDPKVRKFFEGAAEAARKLRLRKREEIDTGADARADRATLAFEQADEAYRLEQARQQAAEARRQRYQLDRTVSSGPPRIAEYDEEGFPMGMGGSDGEGGLDNCIAKPRGALRARVFREKLRRGWQL